jgi:hypothetical protein
VRNHFKNSEELYLYQVSLDIDDLSLSDLPASCDLTLRHGYRHMKPALHRNDDQLTLQNTWKDGSLYERKVTLDHTGDRWSVKEVLTLDQEVFLKPKKGTLTVEEDLSSNLSLKVACDHTFSEKGIELTKLVPTLKLDSDGFTLSWKGTFRPTGDTLELDDYDLTVSSKAELSTLTIESVFKLDEDGCKSFPVKLSLPLSGR